MKKFIISMIAALFVAPIFAQDGGDTVNFSANSMVIDEESRTTELIGNAVLTRGKLTMKADKIIVYSVVGSNGEETFDHMEGIGNVSAKSGDQTITSNNLVYTAATELAIFTGNVVVKKGKSVANANKAELNAKTGIYTLTGPVKGVITGKLP